MGEANRRGTYEERSKQAIKEGRVKTDTDSVMMDIEQTFSSSKLPTGSAEERFIKLSNSPEALPAIKNRTNNKPEFTHWISAGMKPLRCFLNAGATRRLEGSPPGASFWLS